MDQSEFEIQLNVWKDLAVSKQVLIGAATDALGLDPDCSTEELKSALDVATKRAKDADQRIKTAQSEAREAVGEMERKVIHAENARKTAEKERDDATEGLEVAEKQLASERNASAEDAKKLKAEVAEKQKAIKAIHVALADTPDNVVKKLKTLKKQKLDESNSKKRLEGELRNMKKDKQKVQAEADELQAMINVAADLLTSAKEALEVAETYRQQLTDAKVEDVAELPSLDVETADKVIAAKKED